MTNLEQSIKRYYEKPLNSIYLDKEKNKIYLHFTDLSNALILEDDLSQCCETRYITTDDDLAYYSGSMLLDIQIQVGSVVEIEDKKHESQFLKVITSKGTVTFTTHYVNNGYYSGFTVILSGVEL